MRCEKGAYLYHALYVGDADFHRAGVLQQGSEYVLHCPVPPVPPVRHHSPCWPTEKCNFQEDCEVYFQSIQLFLSSSALK